MHKGFRGGTLELCEQYIQWTPMSQEDFVSHEIKKRMLFKQSTKITEYHTQSSSKGP